MSKMSDDDLVKLVQRGNKAAFNELWQRWRETVFGGAMDILKDPADAEDITQEVSIKVWRNLKNFRGDSKFSTWLFAVTANQALMLLRRRKNWKNKTEPIDSILNKTDRVKDIEQQTIERDLIFRLFEAVKTIHGPWQVPLILSWLHYSNFETQAITGRGLHSVKSHLHRARQAFKFIAEEIAA